MKTLTKTLALLILLASTSCINAQFGNRIKGNGDMITKTRNISDYDKVAVGGSFDVKLISGKEGEITIKADSNLIEYIITEVNGDKLSIKWKKGISISSYKNILVTVPFESLDAVSLAGSGDISSNETIKSSNFKTSLSGSGDIELDIIAEKVTSTISGSGDVNLSGKTQDFKCSISGSGNIEAYQLNSIDADIKIVGSGNVELTVTGNLEAKIVGSGDINYKGNPKTQNIRVVGSGDAKSH